MVEEKFTCEICGNEFSSKEQAEECESQGKTDKKPKFDTGEKVEIKDSEKEYPKINLVIADVKREHEISYNVEFSGEVADDIITVTIPEEKLRKIS